MLSKSIRKYFAISLLGALFEIALGYYQAAYDVLAAGTSLSTVFRDKHAPMLFSSNLTAETFKNCISACTQNTYCTTVLFDDTLQMCFFYEAIPQTADYITGTNNRLFTKRDPSCSGYTFSKQTTAIPNLVLPSGLIASSTSSVNVIQTSVKCFESDVFVGFTGVTNVAMYSAGYKSFPRALFNPLINVQALNLGMSYNTIVPRNGLTSIPPGAFRGLTALRSLYIHINEISYLVDDVFEGLINVRSIYVNNNQITTINPKVFTGLSNLVNINIGCNPLTTTAAYGSTAAYQGLVRTSCQCTVVVNDATCS